MTVFFFIYRVHYAISFILKFIWNHALVIFCWALKKYTYFDVLTNM